MFTINCSIAAAQWLEGRVSRKTTWWEKADRPADWWTQLITDNILVFRCRRGHWMPSQMERKQRASMCRPVWQTISNKSLTSSPFLRRYLGFQVQHFIKPLIGGRRYTDWPPGGSCAPSHKSPQPCNHGGGAVRLHRCYTGGPLEVEEELFTILQKGNSCHQEEALMFVARSPEILSMDPVKVATRLVFMMEGFAGSSPNVGNDRCHLGVPHLLELGHDCISTDHHARSQACWQTFDGTPRLLWSPTGGFSAFEPSLVFSWLLFRYVMWLAIILTYFWWTGLICKRLWSFWSRQWMSQREGSQLLLHHSHTPWLSTKLVIRWFFQWHSYHDKIWTLMNTQFLLRCGQYRHPDPGAKAKVSRPRLLCFISQK